MKKILLTVFLLFVLSGIVLADVAPYYINSLKRYGIGFTKVQSPLVMRLEPKKDAKILETLTFDYNNSAKCAINKNKCEIDDIFAQYSTDKKIAFLTTIDSTENWNMVCFNQAQAPVCGWVDDNLNKYYNYIEFFEQFGKKYGIYLFIDLKKPDNILYAAPLKETNSLGSIEMPRFISPWLIRGNWMLVKVKDFKDSKTGWIQFRGSDGKLRLFVKF